MMAALLVAGIYLLTLAAFLYSAGRAKHWRGVARTHEGTIEAQARDLERQAATIADLHKLLQLRGGLLQEMQPQGPELTPPAGWTQEDAHRLWLNLRHRHRQDRQRANAVDAPYTLREQMHRTHAEERKKLREAVGPDPYDARQK